MDPRLVIEGLAAIAMFLTANWIKQMRSDVHELVSKVSEHSEKIAVLRADHDRLRVEHDRLHTWKNEFIESIGHRK